MSEGNMICDQECISVDEYLVTPVNCCPGIHQAEAKSFIHDVLPEIVFEPAPNDGAEEKKGNISTRLKDFLALVRDILLPRPQVSPKFGPNGNGVSAGVIFKSNGGSIQPMIWNPENPYRNRDR